MKKVYPFVAVLLVLVAACSKKTDVVPDAGSVVAGTYTMSYIRFDSANIVQDSLTLPFAYQNVTISGSIVATRLSATVDSLTVTLQQTGEQPQVLPLGRFDVKTNGTANDLYYSTLKVGTSDGTTISIDTDPTRQSQYRYLFRGKK